MFEFNAKLSTAVEDGHRPSPPKPSARPPPAETLRKMQRYWQPSNYRTVGQIYLRENPLLEEPLQPEHIKPRLLGHWGTSPGQNFIYVHLNRLIKEKDASVMFISGPGHGGPALVAQSYLEGTYSQVHAEVTQDLAGMRTLFREFSTPGGVGSHCGPHISNYIHQGGGLC